MKHAALIIFSFMIGVFITLGIGMLFIFFELAFLSSWATENGGNKFLVTISTVLVFYFLYSRFFIMGWLN